MFSPYPTQVSPHQPGPSSAQGLPSPGGCHSAGWQPANAEQQMQIQNEVICTDFSSTGRRKKSFTEQQQVGNLFFFRILRVICFTLSGSLLKSVRAISLEPNLETLKRRMMSCRVADTTKYSCFKRSSFPSKNYG